MNTREIVEAVCTLPDVFRKGTHSSVDLILLSGLPDSPEVLTRTEIAAFLSEQPEVVDSWLRWSADKRTSSGWSFVSEADAFIVGIYPDGERLVFSNRIEACAEFVLREATELVSILRSNNAFKRRRAKTHAP